MAGMIAGEIAKGLDLLCPHPERLLRCDIFVYSALKRETGVCIQNAATQRNAPGIVLFQVFAHASRWAARQ
jgi:hypothetical protein